MTLFKYRNPNIDQNILNLFYTVFVWYEDIFSALDQKSSMEGK